jgi:hypothetical protein
LQTVCQLFVDNGQAGGHTGGQGENFMSDEMKDGRKVEAVRCESAAADHPCSKCVYGSDIGKRYDCRRVGNAAQCEDDVGLYSYFRYTTDTPTLDEWESAIEGETLVQIVQLIAPTEHDHTQIVELRQGAGCSKVWVTNSYGNSFGASIIRRKPQTTTLNFDRQSFSAVGAQFIALGKPGEQPPKESVWIRGDIDEVGIFFNDSSRRVHMSWSELAAKWVYTTDRGATWQRFVMPVGK